MLNTDSISQLHILLHFNLSRNLWCIPILRKMPYRGFSRASPLWLRLESSSTQHPSQLVPSQSTILYLAVIQNFFHEQLTWNYPDGLYQPLFLLQEQVIYLDHWQLPTRLFRHHFSSYKLLWFVSVSNLLTVFQLFLLSGIILLFHVYHVCMCHLNLVIIRIQ